MRMAVMVCRFCGSEREIRAKEIGRITTCGAPECVHQRRVEGGAKPKGQGAANPRYRDGRWTKTEGVCAICGAAFVGPAKRKFCSLACAAADKARTMTSVPFSDERKSRMKGRSGTGPKSEAWKARASERFRGASNPMWKGGVTPANKAGRTTWNYRRWRLAVFERDGHACRMCGTTHSLVAHHLAAYTDHPELRTELDNGMTLCRSCHKRNPPGIANTSHRQD